ncbi:hypothetical protein HanRHA438_Chr16g0759921 [Helianthus annuus]|uniref:Uncharacterized protein n=1 Tax=Helianthus annuus TaxID=4232 RepID=A0A9K3H080_HELAN|nr:hypothetical protein HanXRQr2_Chr16g0748161 [Helianthus annuus]KAJ0442767.1 hypothetical protein HanIR_Chr16g0813101 [Helianthus annuus]KAJ0821200.1 hypothetical protein HanPSC8_Chr16g0717201 [Helianthus annuus]KAJ0835837.1 hypothetical protein HanRHA438_Chr16g0759921 [Helianthus annuus]
MKGESWRPVTTHDGGRRRRPATTLGGGNGSDGGGSRPSTVPVRLQRVWFRFANRVLGQQVQVGCIPLSAAHLGSTVSSSLGSVRVRFR